MFGSKPTFGSASSGTGTSTGTGTGSLFGGFGSSTSSGAGTNSGGIFGAGTTAATNSGSIFGAGTTTATTAATAGTIPFTFPTATATGTSNVTASPFGSLAANSMQTAQTTNNTGFSLGASTNSAAPQFGSSTSTGTGLFGQGQGGNIFGQPAAPAAQSATTAAPSFSLTGSAPAAATTASSGFGTGLTFGTGMGVASGTNTGTSIFGQGLLNKPPAVATTTSITSAPAAGATSAGSSFSFGTPLGSLARPEVTVTTASAAPPFSFAPRPAEVSATSTIGAAPAPLTFPSTATPTVSASPFGSLTANTANLPATTASSGLTLGSSTASAAPLFPATGTGLFGQGGIGFGQSPAASAAKPATTTAPSLTLTGSIPATTTTTASSGLVTGGGLTFGTGATGGGTSTSLFTGAASATPAVPSISVSTPAPSLPLFPSVSTTPSVTASATVSVPSVTAPATTSAGPLFSSASLATPAGGLFSTPRTPAALSSLPLTTPILFTELEQKIQKLTMEVMGQERMFMNQALEMNTHDKIIRENEQQILPSNQELKQLENAYARLSHNLEFVDEQQSELDILVTDLEKKLNLPDWQSGQRELPLDATCATAADFKRAEVMQMLANVDAQLKASDDDITDMIEQLRSLTKKATRDGSENVTMEQISKVLTTQVETLIAIDGNTNEIMDTVGRLMKEVKD
ncbi:hypothetical protein WR25_13476 [Diploscapter pachys]|uniref:Nucleoporin NSP1-like C-terminal domain-containing protein n=1 Tax=Diploscapter pachys TaxID=2018661 RepID=A0A2A2KGQ7_9BILA|nr:hypothetical protein WR25_13476 [Diploscapter pachys]